MLSTDRGKLIGLLKSAAINHHTPARNPNPLQILRESPLKCAGKRVRLATQKTPNHKTPRRDTKSPSKTFTNFFVKQALQSRNRSMEPVIKTEIVKIMKLETEKEKCDKFPKFKLIPMDKNISICNYNRSMSCRSLASVQSQSELKPLLFKKNMGRIEKIEVHDKARRIKCPERVIIKVKKPFIEGENGGKINTMGKRRFYHMRHLSSPETAKIITKALPGRKGKRDEIKFIPFSDIYYSIKHQKVPVSSANTHINLSLRPKGSLACKN